MRSRRPIVTLGAAALACALAFALLTFYVLVLPAGWVAAVALGAGAAAGGGVAVWAGLKLRGWPSCRLALFRDRLVVLYGRHEMRALWDRMETVTLAEPDAWPEFHLTDSLTISSRKESPIRFKPAEFGLEATSCRDLIIRLRDDSDLRCRLPEFDSARDLVASPVVAGELFEPRF